MLRKKWPAVYIHLIEPWTSLSNDFNVIMRSIGSVRGFFMKFSKPSTSNHVALEMSRITEYNAVFDFLFCSRHTENEFY